jgi:NAD(P)H-flavin reductase
MTANNQEKIEWSGTIVSIQPRTTVWRYKLDNRTHYHRGYNVFLDGEVNGLKAPFSVAISEKQQQKLEFRIGDEAKGTAWSKMYDVSDYADYYRAGGLKAFATRRAALSLWLAYR